MTPKAISTMTSHKKFLIRSFIMGKSSGLITYREIKRSAFSVFALKPKFFTQASCNFFGDGETKAAAGTVVKADKKGLKIACGEGTVLEICELQPDGKKRMPANAFLLGKPIPEGSSVR